MSVAMRVKRSLELDSLTEALPLGCAYRATPQKRQRGSQYDCMGSSMSPIQSLHNASSHNGEGQEHGGSAAATSRSPFPERAMGGAELDELLSGCVQGLTREVPEEPAAVGRAGAGRQKSGDDQHYSGAEMREIVGRAVAEREKLLREEYSSILAEKLKEQFNSFTQFNQDYISRQIKGSPFSYVS